MRQLDNLSLAYFVKELKPFFEGAYVNRVSEINSRVLKIKLHTKLGSKDLIITPNHFFISPFSVKARHGKTNFAVSLKKELYNKRIVSIEQYDFDRVVVINFFEHKLVLELMGNGNQVLLDNAGKIISCARNESWADREVKKGVEYKFPKSRGFNPLFLKENFLGLKEFFEESKQPLVKALISSVNVSPLIAEETIFLLGLDKNIDSSSLSNTDLERIVNKLCFFYSLKKSPEPVKYSDFVYYFPLSHLKESPQKILSVNDFVAEVVLNELVVVKEIAGEKKRVEDSVSKLEYHKKQQEVARQKFLKQEFDNKRKAELIYQHYVELEELRKAILSAVEKGFSEKEIMKRIKSEAEKGNKSASLLKKIDLASKKFEVEL